MALMDAAKNAMNQVSGNLEKAVIEIIDMRGRELIKEEAVNAGGSSGTALQGLNGGLVSGVSGSMNLMSTASTLAGTAAITDSILDMAGTAASKFKGEINLLHGATKKYFYVQFNPSELSFSGYGGGLSTKTDFTSSSGISFEPVQVRITMDVRLIFDKVDPQDAFMGDKLNTAPTSLATGVAKAVKSKKGKKDQSVQTEVEGFMAALRSPYTRRITFQWGKMVYTGILNRVSAEYQMFNVNGQPIRAAVNLSLVCADQEVMPNSMGTWQKQYEAAFGAGDQSLVKSAQKVGNLFNVNL